VPRERERRDELLMSLFEAALELPLNERADWIRNCCPDEPDLLHDVLERIDWELEMTGFLTEPVLRSADRTDLEPNSLLGNRLRIVRKIAEGGMAVVYEARDEKIGPVAVKLPKAAYSRRLLAEVRFALQVTHPNICRVHGVETARTDDGEIQFLTMEYLAGETLQERIRRAAPSHPRVG
jgi:serine/threonine protein kinase